MKGGKVEIWNSVVVVVMIALGIDVRLGICVRIGLNFQGVDIFFVDK